MVFSFDLLPSVLAYFIRKSRFSSVFFFRVPSALALCCVCAACVVRLRFVLTPSRRQRLNTNDEVPLNIQGGMDICTD